MTQPDRAAELLLQAGALVVTAGAGMGVCSGLPDFRGDTGFWRAYPALGARGLCFSEVASPRTFEQDAALAWGFYGHRLGLYRSTIPHAGFALLRRWGDALGLPMTVFTSNVDGQFQRAGFPEAEVHECHGSIHWLQCLRPCSDELWSAADLAIQVDEARCRWLGELPRCPRCGGLARPNILMFGDTGWVPSRTQRQALRQRQMLAGLHRPLVIEIGAGTAIPTVRMFSNEVVHHHGGRLVRINPRECTVPSLQDVGMACPALAGLQAVDAALSAAQ
jgi:NAD-dependent SIR2 family protein deacetylase